MLDEISVKIPRFSNLGQLGYVNPVEKRAVQNDWVHVKRSTSLYFYPSLFFVFTSFKGEVRPEDIPGKSK